MRIDELHDRGEGEWFVAKIRIEAGRAKLCNAIALAMIPIIGLMAVVGGQLRAARGTHHCGDQSVTRE